MPHRSARLTVFSRQLLVDRVLVGRPVAMVAQELGVSRATGYKWVRATGRRAGGSRGPQLPADPLPRRSPRERGILCPRASARYGPDRLASLTGHPRSTISGVLRGRA